jgi:hypothetical protein
VAARYTRNQLRRTIEDLGALVDGNEVYVYSNPGEGLSKQFATSDPATPIFDTPKPKRIYDGVEFSATRRFSNRWFASGSYVWSRLYGNYAGLGNTDEITPTSTNLGSTTAQQTTSSTARPGSSGSRAWDLDQILFDSRGNFIEGRLATDRPHSFKLYGSYTTPWNTEIGGFQLVQSGTPMSTYVQSTANIPVMVNGRGDMGRTPVLAQTNLIVAQEFKLGETKKLRFEFNADNLFNQKTARYLFPYLNRGAATRRAASAMNLAGVNLLNGYDYNALLAKAPEASTPKGALDPRYGLADTFNTGFAGRFQVKFIF